MAENGGDGGRPPTGYRVEKVETVGRLGMRKMWAIVSMIVSLIVLLENMKW